jgi:O-methyltransferase
MDSPHKPLDPFTRKKWVQTAYGFVERTLARRGYQVVKRVQHDYSMRALGADVPIDAETGIGLSRLENLRDSIETVLADDVTGDLLEAGVLRGGASIYMRAVLAVHGDSSRTVWVADSFEGPPTPDLDEFPQDADMFLHLIPAMAVSLDEVRRNFARYGLLDHQVQFLKGWFKDTLFDAPIKNLSILRLDGDSYEATTQIFDALYDKVSAGGFVIVDDYLRFSECKQATDDFRDKHAITDPYIEIDMDGIVWRKGA